MRWWPQWWQEHRAALQVDYKRVSDRHKRLRGARHSHDGKFSVSLCAGHGLGVALANPNCSQWLAIASGRPHSATG